jgi:penicillin amidase
MPRALIWTIMKKILSLSRTLIACFVFTCSNSFSQDLQVPGLQQPVEVFRDQYGVNHIYAQNEHDLFFAQGYCAAKDRLFQFEIWRRRATGID